MQHLLYEPRPLWGDIVPLDVRGRVAVALEYATLVALLHAKTLVIGDISMMNFCGRPEIRPGCS